MQPMPVTSPGKCRVHFITKKIKIMKKQIISALESITFKTEWVQLRECMGYDTAFYFLCGKYLTDEQNDYILENEDIIPLFFEW